MVLDLEKAIPIKKMQIKINHEVFIIDNIKKISEKNKKKLLITVKDY